jgi:hypothetical protein
MRPVAPPSHRTCGAAYRKSAPQLIQRNTLAPERAEVASRKTGATRSIVMWDLVMLALGLGFFAAAIGYSYACERL